ncbi:GlcNAc-transferase family protein [Roseateles saccharophilus]|uniref:UDP-N-acetylglucosamine (GlcNAc):hydroxyproline polypeptide GlcNAc-transferase n=2 Tax=Roseateles saccharophilus TaxID=304 RepID=A0A4R3VBT4_ROSSA|nr:GlcNAc-transferase family protein [Roseateles saccharophilus]TCV01253.1 UDP-N-acetylglucosamine (GlcNAc):hydroxyproline polypeptide GlcNAc-transferase [Roseateles saccharophilus]
MPQPVDGPDRIFISIAAYCDPMLAFTITSALTQASRPERVSIGLVEQQWPEACVRLPEAWQAQLRRVQLHPLEARGPCWARALAMSLHQGEDWFLQVDSHMWFEPGWDERLVCWGRRCAVQNPRSLISTYPNPFTMRGGEPVAQVVGAELLAFVVRNGQQFGADHPVLMFEAVPVAGQNPLPAMHVGAGCFFGPGRLVNELPYDPFLYFHGEEQAFALRAWTRGWDLFHIPGMPIYHQYVSEDTARPMHWAPELDAQRLVRSAALSEAANRRMAALLWDGADLGIYGLGTARSLADYATFSGIDYGARALAPHAFKSRYGY